MIDTLKPKLVVIAVPPKVQSKIIKYLIPKKISFFAQKPLTYNFQDAQIIHSIIKNYKNSVIFNESFVSQPIDKIIDGFIKEFHIKYLLENKNINQEELRIYLSI